MYSAIAQSLSTGDSLGSARSLRVALVDGVSDHAAALDRHAALLAVLVDLETHARRLLGLGVHQSHVGNVNRAVLLHDAALGHARSRLHVPLHAVHTLDDDLAELGENLADGPHGALVRAR